MNSSSCIMLHHAGPEYHRDLFSAQFYSCMMYVNDIGLNIHSEIRLFADDILLYQPIRTPDDHLQLQEDLNTLTKWASDWKMMFNIPKRKIIQFTTHRNKSKHLYHV